MRGKARSLKLIIASLIAAMLIFIPVMAVPQSAEAATISPNVTKHSREEIKNFYENKNIQFNVPVSYKINPSAYNTIGELDDNTNKTALAALNYYRYIAGLSNYNVKLNPEFSKYAQSAAFYLDLTKVWKHEIEKDNRINNTIYYDACRGVRGNLSTSSSLTDSVKLWIAEHRNDSVGHRAKILSPDLANVGFGSSNIVSSKSVVYSSGPHNSKLNDMVVWPAQLTPIDAFDGSQYWSVTGIDRDFDSKWSITRPLSSVGFF